MLCLNYVFVLFNYKPNFALKLQHKYGFIMKGLPDVFVFTINLHRQSHRQGIRCQEGGCPELVSDVVVNLRFLFLFLGLLVFWKMQNHCSLKPILQQRFHLPVRLTSVYNRVGAS